MKCMKCGYEATGRRTCPKCGMPLVDYTVKPEEEKEDTVTELGKRNLELEPIAKAEAEKKKEKREEKRKKREEEEKKKEEEAVKRIRKMALAAMGIEEEDFDEEEEEEDDEEEAFTFRGDEEEPEEPDDDKNSDSEKESEGKLTISDLIENFFHYEEEEITVTGEVTFSEVKEGKIRINLDDEENSLVCENVVPDAVEWEGMLFEKEEITDILSDLDMGIQVKVTGIFTYEEEPQLHLKEIEGEDFYLRIEK